MHIRSKFDGGKQINRSQSGSWEARCYGAGLHANEGPQWGPKMWEKITGGKANPVYTAASAKQEKMAKADKMRKATDKAKSSRRASKRAISNDNSLKTRKIMKDMMMAMESKRLRTTSHKLTFRT